MELLAIESGLTIISFTLAIFSLISIIYFGGYRLGRLELKVDTMWNFQMRRAFSEVRDRKLGEMNSPYVFKPEVVKFLDPLKDELIQFWDAHQAKLNSDAEALLEIERVFGEKLLQSVCPPLGLTHGACLLLAFAVARQRTEIDFEIK